MVNNCFVTVLLIASSQSELHDFHEIQQREMTSPAHGGHNPPLQYRLWPTSIKAALQKQVLGILVDTKLNMGKECFFSAKKANSLQGCIRKIIENYPLLHIGELNLKSWVISGLLSTRKAGTVQWRGLLKGNGVCHIWGMAGKAGTLQPGEEKISGICLTTC